MDNPNYKNDGLILDGLRNDGNVLARTSVFASECQGYWVYSCPDTTVTPSPVSTIQQIKANLESLGYSGLRDSSGNLNNIWDIPLQTAINVFLSDYGLSTQYSTDATHVYVYTQQAVNRQITKVTNSSTVESEMNSAQYDLYTYGVYDAAAVAYMTNTEYNTGDDSKAADTSIYNKKDYVRFDNGWYGDIRGNFNSHLGDCANFAAQALVAGGVKMNQSFYFYKGGKLGASSGSDYLIYDCQHSSIWTIVPEQYDYFSNKSNGYTKSDAIILSNNDEISKYAYDIKAGDLCYFDWGVSGKADGEVNHAAMITKVENGKLYYSTHSSNRINRILDLTDKNIEPGTVVHIIKMER